MSEPFDVTIVGYGPVGQTLAILLAQRGWRIGVFEKQPAPYPLPRAVHFDHEVARILQAAGLGEALPGLTEPADVYEWRNANGETLLRIGSRQAGLSGWPEANMFSQPELERALDARARALSNVAVYRGAEIVDLEVGGEGVEVTVQCEDRRREVHARAVVGCDGANSFVRGRIGARVTDLGYFYDWLIVDVVPHEPRVWDPINEQICDPARPTTMVSGGPGRRRWEFMRLPSEEVADLNNEATAWRLLEPWRLDRTNATLERHAVYTFQARWVDDWRRGRIFLAGDAAHQMPPFAGQGMCSGIRDAANLAWKLDLWLRGIADERLLDTYASERIPQVRQVIEFSIELGKVICVPDRDQAAARDEAMIARSRETGLTPSLPTPAIGPGAVLQGDALAGHLFLQAEVEANGRRGLFDDVVGSGFALVSCAGNPLSTFDSELAAFFTSIGGIAAHVGGAVRDVRASYAQWFCDHRVGVVLSRPDFHVFGTGSAVEDGSRLVRALRSTLEGRLEASTRNH